LDSRFRVKGFAYRSKIEDLNQVAYWFMVEFSGFKLCHTILVSIGGEPDWKEIPDMYDWFGEFTAVSRNTNWHPVL